MNPLDERSAYGKDLYLTKQHSQQSDIHNPVGFEPAVPAGERPQTYALDRAATEIGKLITVHIKLMRNKKNAPIK
jgi:hypothetical protein